MEMVQREHRETCRILRLRRPPHGKIPHGKIGIDGGGILQNLTKNSKFFSKKKNRSCGFGLPERGADNSMERCTQNTHPWRA